MSVEILNLRPVQNRGNLKAFADIKIGEILIRSFRVVQQPGRRPWVSPPVESWEGDDGQRHYKRLVVLPEDLGEEVSRAILAAWRKGRNRPQGGEKTQGSVVSRIGEKTGPRNEI